MTLFLDCKLLLLDRSRRDAIAEESRQRVSWIPVAVGLSTPRAERLPISVRIIEVIELV